MVDGIYQSVMVFFVPYLTFINAGFITDNGLDVQDRLRLGCYVAHPAVLTINLYILINTYRWDWIMLLVVVLSDLFIFFWTGVYTATSYSAFFYDAAPQVYAQASFWAVFFITPVICLLPRYAVKAIQKVYFPYDVDIIREQVVMGAFKHVGPQDAIKESVESGSSDSSTGSAVKRHQQFPSVDEDRRPIYPPTLHSTTTHNARSQNGSDGTNYTRHEASTEITVRPSLDRVRPSYDRMRASMDRMRPSYEQSNDFTSAAMLSRYESTRSGPTPEPSAEGAEGIVSRIRRRTRGKSFKSAFQFHHKDDHIAEHE
jgi:phospholipid-translocating ATPase